MKRAYLIPLIVLVLATMACSLTGTKPTDAPPAPTKEAVAGEKATQPPAQPEKKATEAKPAATEAAPTEAPAATEEPATEAPAATEAPQATGVEETFDMQSKNWTDPFIVTSQASGRDPRVKLTTESGMWRFAISDKETYVYSLYNQALPDATTLEADFQLKGALNTNIAMVCKANEDHSSWYELQVSGGYSFYVFFRYDKALKEQENKNPYVQLGKGVMKATQYYPTKPNHIVFTCSGDQLSVDINNGKLKGSAPVDTQLDGNLWGLGVKSADVLPGTVDFDKVVIK